MSVINKTEQTVLGILLDNPNRIDEAGLTEEHFFDARSRKIFQALTELKRKNKPTDVLTVAAKLEEMGMTHISSLDVADYMIKLLDLNLPKDTLGHYAGVLQERLTKKRSAEIGAKLASGEISYTDAIEKLSNIETGFVGGLTLKEEIEYETTEIERDIRTLAQGGSISYGLGPGLGLGRVCPSGLPLSCVGVLCGDTGSGKTTVAQNIARHVAQNNGAIIFSVEDGREIFRQKTISQLSGVPLHRIITRQLDSIDLARISAISEQAKNICDRIILDTTPGPTAEDIIRKARMYRRQNGAKLVVVDYLQILARSKGSKENDALRDMMLAFQHAAKADEMHYLIISQLNRGHLRDREDPRPRRHDLYGSGSIEQFSKLILAVFKPANYGPPVPDRHYDAEFENPPTPDVWANRLELWVIKNNKGEDNVFVNVNWDGETGRMIEE